MKIGRVEVVFYLRARKKFRQRILRFYTSCIKYGTGDVHNN